MSFFHFQFYGNHWEQATDDVERRLRPRSSPESEEPEPEFLEAELDDHERRAAIARERARRFGVR
jgi:hypothetical protein